MVVALGPGKFYGRILARPRFYDNPIGDRVSPPTPVLDPLMSWAEEAHWSMGGLSFKRLRLQGRIEGNIKKLKAERAKFEKKGGIKSGSSPVSVSLSPSPPPAPLNLKRKRRLIDESDDENDEEIEMRVEKRGPVRKLDDEFDRVASSKSDRRTRGGRNREDVVVEVNKVKGKKLKKGGVVVVTPNVTRTSPKKLKKGGVVVVTPNVTRSSPRLSKRK